MCGYQTEGRAFRFKMVPAFWKKPCFLDGLVFVGGDGVSVEYSHQEFCRDGDITAGAPPVIKRRTPRNECLPNF